MKNCWEFTHPQVNQDVWACFFIGTDLENVALHHLFTDVSSAVNGRRQNESPNSW